MTISNFAAFSKITNKAWYFIRIVCQQGTSTFGLHCHKNDVSAYMGQTDTFKNLSNRINQIVYLNMINQIASSVGNKFECHINVMEMD